MQSNNFYLRYGCLCAKFRYLAILLSSSLSNSKLEFSGQGIEYKFSLK